jgi:hypothetical protein
VKRPSVPDDTHNGVREALPRGLRADWEALDDYYSDLATARENVLFQVGVRVGRALAGGAQ